MSSVDEITCGNIQNTAPRRHSWSHTRVQSKAKSRMLLSCSSSWWYRLTLSGSLRSHKPLSLVPPCNRGKQCLTGIATPDANRDLLELSDLDLCYSRPDHKTISRFQALHGRVRPPWHWENSSTCNSPAISANIICTRLSILDSPTACLQ